MLVGALLVGGIGNVAFAYLRSDWLHLLRLFAGSKGSLFVLVLLLVWVAFSRWLGQARSWETAVVRIGPTVVNVAYPRADMVSVEFARSAISSVCVQTVEHMGPTVWIDLVSGPSRDSVARVVRSEFGSGLWIAAPFYGPKGFRLLCSEEDAQAVRIQLAQPIAT
ncbi:hypothetical protein [Ramlibacter sp. AN1133]|uniref:hypothetical protein n=1 Tax=Ramlibacter sp. AN1133 TaxID=3133429 RepID=UPI0030BAAFEC